MRQFAAAIILMGTFSLLAPAQSGLTLVRSDAGFVFGIEWRRIVDSPSGSAIVEQIKKAEASGFEGLRNALLTDLDSVVIAGSTAKLSSGQQPPALIVIKGRFNIAQLRGLIPTKEQKIEKYGDLDMLIIPEAASTAKNRLVFFDNHTILAGDRGEVRTAIDRIKAGRLSLVRSSIVDLAAKNEIWMAIEFPPDAMKSAPPPAQQMFASMKSAEMGMSFQQGLGIQMNIRTADDASAKSMAQALQGLVAMGAMGQSENRQATEMLKKIQITPENTLVKLALSLDRSEFEQMVKEAQTGRTSVASTAPAAPVRPPEPAGPKTIRITGLSSGPVEVPLTTK